MAVLHIFWPRDAQINMIVAYWVANVNPMLSPPGIPHSGLMPNTPVPIFDELKMGLSFGLLTAESYHLASPFSSIFSERKIHDVLDARKPRIGGHISSYVSSSGDTVQLLEFP